MASFPLFSNSRNHLDVVCYLLQVTCNAVPLHLDTLRFRKILWLVKRYQQQFHVNQFPSISFINWLLWRGFVTNSKHAMRDEREVLNQTSWWHDEMKMQVPHALPPPPTPPNLVIVIWGFSTPLDKGPPWNETNTHKNRNVMDTWMWSTSLAQNKLYFIWIYSWIVNCSHSNQKSDTLHLYNRRTFNWYNCLE